MSIFVLAIKEQIMNISKLLGVIIISLSVFFLGLQSQALELEASGVRAFTMLLLTALYLVRVKNKHVLFLSFLIVFTIAELFNWATWLKNFDIDPNFDYFYYVGNALYILAYLLLIFRILVGFSIVKAMSKFPLQSLLLIVLGVFVVYLVTDTTRETLNNSEYTLEFTYNAVIMVLMNLSLLNYMYRDDKKSMNLLIGSICIVFSEILQLAYFYIAADFNVLNVLCSAFLVAAFLFFYLQSRLVHKDKNVSFVQQDLKV
ncbi:hypothetical protein [Psychroserpens sp. SPM9]|uniref:hypothetical protein n=1 Tax=Psychroserpens sp. SPM9 TaxID=2975598 RepID=UPI0021A31D8E|nr:hypothetical protein [Psychroserpens sp. SPM9]MDG5491701.1 hypothetical protein [Psychroserpens sp. SPM9]